MTEVSSNAHFALDSLEAIRKRLLDLTGRNRLLNFKHSGRGLIRIIDELPDQLTSLLLQGKQVTFVSIPEPTREELLEHGYIRLNEKRQEEKLKPDPSAKEWAKVKGFDIAYELKKISSSHDAKHNDTNIQTLFYPYELESLLRAIRNKANTAIQETGANILYIAFGFLEWYEDMVSEVARHAPLYLVPVKIEKAQLDRDAGVYQYTIEYTGEDIVSNLSLREKLRVDFHLGLPEIEEDELPEEYLARVESQILQHKPKWAIRRYATLAMFDFGKLLMYLDLDPSRWPDGEQNIQNHEILKKFFSSQSETNSTGGAYGFASEYEIDSLESVHDLYPLIDDADSSQHSALVDAINGENLVVEGPPGSGKSQTITNLIAALIVQGKKVLFVAEKMAALNVVKARLERAGLGDFCLELHSNKIQKKQVYYNLRERIENQDKYQYPNRISLDIKLYETKKEQLTKYADLINSKWKETGLTIHEIFTRATKFRQQYKKMTLEEVYPSNISGVTFDEATCQSMIDELKRYALVYENVREQLGSRSKLEEHPWFGAYNTKLQMFDTDAVCSELEQWQTCLLTLKKQADDINTKIGTELASHQDIKNIIEQLNHLPDLTGTEDLNAFQNFNHRRLEELDAYLEKFDDASKAFRELSNVFEKNVFSDPSEEVALNEAAEVAKSRFLLQNIKLDSLHHCVENLLTIISLLAPIKEDIETIHQQAPVISQLFDISIDGIQEFQTLLTLQSKLDPTLINRRNELFDQVELDSYLAPLKEILGELQPLHKKLSEAYRLDQLPSLVTLKEARDIVENAGFFKWFQGDWRRAKSLLFSVSASLKPRLSNITPQLGDLVRYKELFDDLNREPKYAELLKTEYTGVNTGIDDLIRLREWYSEVRKEYGFGFGKRTPLANFVFSVDGETFKGIHHLASTRSLREITTFLNTIKKVKNIIRVPAFTDTGMELRETELTDIYDELLAVVMTLQSKTKANLTLGEITQHISELRNASSIEQQLESLDTLSVLFGRQQALNVRHPDSKRLNVIKTTRNLYYHIQGISDSSLREYIEKNISAHTLEMLKIECEELVAKNGKQQDAYSLFKKKVNLDIDAWTQHSGCSMSDLIERNKYALAQPLWLTTWLDFLRVRGYLSEKGLENLLRMTEQGKLKLSELEDVYQFTVFDILSREIITEKEDLANFSGANHAAIQQQFKEYDNKLKALQREKIAYFVARHGEKQIVGGNASGRVSTYTEMGLLYNEVNKKSRHTPLRQAIRRASQSLQALKPCFMMGPNSVAQFLEPGQIYFDVVVMDEASQIKPEDALGTIARGKQVVVVGDPKQLPPTSFFDKTVENDSEDATAIEQSESILDVSIPMFNLRRLRWHYRSRHESLIAFSNKEFYDNNLVIFPSPSANSDEFGIKFTHVKRGYFVNQRNIEEAQVIAEAVRHHLLHRPHESLGVVAMSAQQREQIERCVEELSKDDSSFMQALIENEATEEPLFLKNLENVQGDERDVIFISFTYGPQKVGDPNMPQRFGPINHASGGRRLNVLFTRSKKRMHAFSSMTEGHVQINPNSSPGVKALKKFLGFAQTGNLHQAQFTGRGPDNDFEIAVMDELHVEGFECVPQVGVGGYFIDLAVKDPGQPGRYLMGIECDGATYHSAKSARDRDRLRQSVLESLGWNIKRIWSTDWFKNPEAQLRPIIEQLHDLKTETSSVHGLSELDEIEDIIEEEECVHEKTDKLSHSGLVLRDKLVKFNEEVVLPYCGDVEQSQHLLRPAMIDALLEFRPISKNEFVEVIPGYLRKATSPKQGKYLEQVLNIIAEDELEKEEVS